MDAWTIAGIVIIALIWLAAVSLFWLSRPGRTVLYRGDCKHSDVTHRLGYDTGTCSHCGATINIMEWLGHE